MISAYCVMQKTLDPWLAGKGGGIIPWLSYREPLFRVHLDHPPEQVLTVGRHEVGDVELASLHLQFRLSINTGSHKTMESRF